MNTLLAPHSISQRAMNFPDALAVVDGTTSLTRSELEACAIHLAARLRAAGVGPGSFVGITLGPGAQFVVAALAVMKAGAAYVPVDEDDGLNRIRQIAETVTFAAWIVAAGSSGRQSIAGREPLLVAPDLLNVPVVSDAERADLDAVGRAIDPKDPVYVIFTSGTTGIPKGVVVPHGGLANLLDWQRVVLDLRSEDRLLQRSKLTFDFSVTELWLTLAHGGTSVVCPDGHRTDVRTFLQFIRDYGVTLAQFVPTVLSAWLAHLDESPTVVPDALRAVVCNGEALPDAVRVRFTGLFPGAALFNQYGPAEATVAVTSHECSRDPQPLPMSVGPAAPGITVHLLDSDLRPVPAGQEGEVCLSGVQLANGYLGASPSEQARFTEAAETGIRIYRTGDLGRLSETGELTLIGRIDQQVKFRGHRLELDAIATEIETVAGVRQASLRVQTVHGSDGRDRQVLTAIVIPEEADVPLIKKHCRVHLPRHAVPGLILPVAEMRSTPNGKLDFGAHIAEAAAARASEPRDAAASISEGLVLDVIEERFGIGTPWAVPSAELDSLGLDSLDRIAILERLNQRGIELSLDVLAEPGVTVHQLAAASRMRSGSTRHDRQTPTVGEVADTLQALGRDSGGSDVIVVHASLPDLARSQDISALRSTFVKAIAEMSRAGLTIAVPSFTPSFAESGRFHHQTSVSESGSLATWLQDDLAGSLRTRDPVYSYVVVGRRSHELPQCAGDHPFGPESVASWFEEVDAAVVGMGTYAFTQTHRVEYLAGAPHHADVTTVSGVADYGDGPTPVTVGVYQRDVDYYGAGAVFAQDVDRTRSILGPSLRAVPFGRSSASMYVTSAGALRDSLLPPLLENPMALLADSAGARRALGLDVDQASA
jgi:amino acid adenylation domain-containing protein